MSKCNSNNTCKLNNHDFFNDPLQHYFEHQIVWTIDYRTLPNIKQMTNRLPFYFIHESWHFKLSFGAIFFVLSLLHHENYIFWIMLQNKYLFDVKKSSIDNCPKIWCSKYSTEGGHYESHDCSACIHYWY